MKAYTHRTLGPDANEATPFQGVAEAAGKTALQHRVWNLLANGDVLSGVCQLSGLGSPYLKILAAAKTGKTEGRV